MAAKLAEILGMDKDTILLRLQKDTSYVKLAGKVEDEVNDQILAFKLEYSLSNALYSTPTSSATTPTTVWPPRSSASSTRKSGRLRHGGHL